MNLSVVMFDLDDTLFAHAASVRAGVLAHRTAHGGKLAAADEQLEWERWHALEEEHYPRFLDGELGFHEQRRVRVRAFVEPYGIDLSDDATADAWFAAYFDRYREAWHLHDDAIPCLDALAEALPGVRFGIITNAEFEGQREKLQTLDALHRFEHVIASGEVGVAKPHSRIFEVAVATFGVTPAQAAYVGDRLETDALGAAGAGLTGVWVDRAGLATAEELERAAAAGVFVVRGLDELVGVLATTTL
jgi:putative hydrolase of the HAD superfamily